MAYGSAFIAIKAMMIKIDNNNAANVAVLGNNINGIMTAIELVKRGFKIKLYS
jgi:heterodisulfide reductase subunit A-like polyferredoxin